MSYDIEITQAPIPTRVNSLPHVWVPETCCVSNSSLTPRLSGNVLARVTIAVMKTL